MKKARRRALALVMRVLGCNLAEGQVPRLLVFVVHHQEHRPACILRKQDSSAAHRHYVAPALPVYMENAE